MNEIIIKGLNVYLPNSDENTIGVHIRDGSVIKFLGKDSNVSDNIDIKQYPDNYHLIPGMIDMHIHGSHSADVMDATPEALQTIADALLAQGTTGFLATTMTEKQKNIESALTNIATFVKTQQTGATVLGVHLEGPFISPHYAGAQNADYIVSPDIELFKHYQTLSKNLIKMVTIAPEAENAKELITYLKAEGIIVAFGHSNADYHQTIKSIDDGVTHATHLFNAMKGIHHREPGAVTAILLRDEVYAELIVDNIHLDPAIAQLCLKTKTAEKLLLVTDAMRAQCMPAGTYSLGGQKIIVDHTSARLEDGTLAGSIVTLPEAMANLMSDCNCSVQELVKMTSTNAAIQLNVQPRGFVVLDDMFNVVDVLH